MCSKLICTVGLLLASGSISIPSVRAALPVDPVSTYAISADSLDGALGIFLRGNRINILYSPSELMGLRSGGAKGQFTIRQALASILQGTGFTAVETAPYTFVLQRDRRSGRAASSVNPVVLNPAELDAVQVTGSRIPRLALQTSSPLTVIYRKDIIASGRNSLPDILRTLPLMNGHRSLDVSLDSGASVVPLSVASGASLYDFGPRATLILVNGKRMPNFASLSTALGSLPDLSAIPVGLIQRIEISTGGASAIYGADAISGVVNIILMDYVEGGKVSLGGGVSSRGDSEKFAGSFAYGASLSGGGDVFFGADLGKHSWLQGHERNWVRHSGDIETRIPLGSHIDKTNEFVPDCPGADQWTGSECLLDRSLYTSLVPKSTNTSLFISYRQPLGEMTISSSLLDSRNWLDMTFPPSITQAPASSQASERNYGYFDVGNVHSRTGARLSLISLALEGEWLHGSWDISAYRNEVSSQTIISNLVNAERAQRAYQEGSYTMEGGAQPEAIEFIRAQGTGLDGKAWIQALSATISDKEFDVAGSVGSLVAGVEVRQQGLRFYPSGDLARGEVAGFSQNLGVKDDRRTSMSSFIEFNIDLSGRLSLDMAGRVDHSQRFGSQLTPRLGIKWDVTHQFSVRGSIAAGYREPSEFELREVPVEAGQVFIPSSVYPGKCPRMVVNGAEGCLLWIDSDDNRNLRPERSWSGLLGFLWAPSDTLYFGLDYHRFIRYSEIGYFDPSDRSLFGYYAGMNGFFKPDDDGVLRKMMVKLTNDYESKLEGWQLSGAYRHAVGGGSFRAKLSAEFLQELRRSDRRGTNQAGRSGPKAKVGGALEWSRGVWNFTVGLHYRSGVSRPAYAPRPSKLLIHDFLFMDGTVPPRIPSMTTVDLGVAYERPGRWRLDVSMLNAMNRAPVNRDASLGGAGVSDDDVIGRYFNVRFEINF